jgi:hypothetical protein
MKPTFNPCARHAGDISLLASGVLPEDEAVELKNHLAACADCRRQYAETAALIRPLADWEKGFAHVRPQPAQQARWANAVAAAGGNGSVSDGDHPVSFREWLHQVLWPARRVWAGVGVIWILLLAANSSLRPAASRTLAANGPAPSAEIIRAFLERQGLVAVWVEPRPSPAAESPKRTSPSPRSERRIELLVT